MLDITKCYRYRGWENSYVRYSAADKAWWLFRIGNNTPKQRSNIANNPRFVNVSEDWIEFTPIEYIEC